MQTELNAQVRLGDGVEYKADRLPNAAAADGAAAADAGWIT